MNRILVTLAAVVLSSPILAACSVVPQESVELSNTIGRDLEEVHKAHRRLAEIHFERIEDEVNTFIDATYRPAYIAKFAEEFQLQAQVQTILQRDPDKLLPVLTRFVEIATERVEKQKRELLAPILEQKQAVLSEIDAAHRQLQSAQAIVTGHLASVRKVKDMQNEALAKAGLEGLQERVAETTAGISDRVAGLVQDGNKIDAKVQNASEKVAELDQKIHEIKGSLSRKINGGDNDE